MVEVYDCKNNPQLLLKFEQNSKQCHRIRSAGDGHADSVPGPQQAVFADVSGNFLFQGWHGYIVQPGAENASVLNLEGEGRYF